MRGTYIDKIYKDKSTFERFNKYMRASRFALMQSRCRKLIKPIKDYKWRIPQYLVKSHARLEDEILKALINGVEGLVWLHGKSNASRYILVECSQKRFWYQLGFNSLQGKGVRIDKFLTRKCPRWQNPHFQPCLCHFVELRSLCQIPITQKFPSNGHMCSVS